MILDEKAISDFTKHVLAEYPKEACGFVVGKKYVPCKNIADDPLHHFKISTDVYLKHEKTGKLNAVLHSHPYKINDRLLNPPEWPSTRDMQAWLAGNLPWGMVATDGEGLSQVVWLDESVIAPLEGREFVHGINDCYAIVRDWYRINRNVTLPNYARGYGWWDSGEDLYSKNFEEGGFVEVPFGKVNIGDLACFKVRSPVINHVAVVTGNNQIMHHLFHRLSGTDQLSKWYKHIVKYMTYVGPK